ncbi:basic secretory protein-like protein [Pedobacter heparinus]|uniref:WD40 domain protein beta Propeller n=1 Tax=Pedobacter heparinus (strain ATCC 13125 / DSM 2366 / CIP 104194 / JCM 7457 / NBRC 12017 / NCIMB 9290 / NRRL B-14731 / HIM 762-3) TaxID=485917 RepID=C6XW43_PEDHD|nr:basic secretory protein-like protein [Pedobacter heparinus]ACU04122.1 WD40 domain protein beta Propeller [Pedobacter heparinus DSM 2366]
MNKSYTFLKRLIPVLFIFTMFSTSLHAQYFGQNRVRYNNEKFKVLQTPHFEIYYYLKNEQLIQKFAQDAETWYKMHQEIFRDTFLKKNPIILYNNHPDFQQTTALQGEVGIGTGGVTEAFKNRVIMPVMELNNQTRHVLGHELVHAFQYHLLLEKDSVNLENVSQIPLWMIEGMAEYLSVGKTDAFTSMWMRDALLNRDIPSLKDLTNSNKYFPYRYGQAFWTFVGSVYGDTTIVPLFKATAKYGYENGLRYTFGYDDRTLSGLWKNAIEAHYRPMLRADSSQIRITGTKIIDNKNAGNMNVAPSISPDGKYLAFLSEKDLFGIDLFLADAKTGKIIRKLSSQVANSHIDDFNFLESAGTWSPDGKQFAFSIFSKGKNQLMIINIDNGSVALRADMGDVAQFGNLSWSPNGDDIAFSGMIQGQSDIFSYNLKTKKVTQITNDAYSDYAPAYSQDGKKIAFSSDRASITKNNNTAVHSINLSIYDIESKTLTDIPVFPGANNLNAQFSGDSKRLFFLSNRDGFRNLYAYNLADNTVKQLTDYFTGISGITEFSPAISVSRNDDIVYSYYRSQRYTLYNSPISSFRSKPVDANAVNFDAAVLPPMETIGVDIVNSNLGNFERFEKTIADSMRLVPYKPKFKLDYLANSGVGVSTSRFGTGVQGGIVGMFSDILGRNQIVANLSVNGEIYDFGGLVGYINQQNRINWGVALSHIPYITGFREIVQTTLDNNGTPVSVIDDRTNLIRTFEDQAQVFGAYPFNKVHRFETGGAFSRYSYRVDRISNYYENLNGYPGYYITSDKRKVPLSEATNDLGVPLKSFSIFQLNASFVGDNSINGITSPLEGFRYRLGMEQYFGDYKFSAATIDVRKYWRLKPITIAARSYNYLRIGKDGENLYPLYVGYPYFIRGYEANSLYNSGSTGTSNGFDINQLSGSKMAVFNFELRLPFTGPKKLSAIPSKFLFTDLNLFFDAGLAWNEDSKVVFKNQPTNNIRPKLGSDGLPVKDLNNNPVYTGTNERVPALSVGISLRVNVFGYFVLEPYYAIPFQRKDISAGVFGLTFAPGW